MSDDEGLFADAGGAAGFPTAGPRDCVEFGWEDDKNKKMTGRRKKLQRKVKPGSFGEFPAAATAAAAAAACQLHASPLARGPAETLGLSEPVLRAIKRKGYRLPTPIQRKTAAAHLAGP